MKQTVRDLLALILRFIPMRGRWRLVDLVVGNVTEPTPVVARVPHVGLMELDLSSGLEREIYVTGTHGEEDVVSKWILKYLNQDGAIFVDVGANVGYHTVCAGRYIARTGGRVIAFEPIKANYERLLTNIKLNRLNNIQVENLGLADREETVQGYRDTKGSSNFSLAYTGDIREQIQLVRFDDWVALNALDRLDVIKLDIEGAEVRAIRGMLAVIKRFRPVLVVEINPMWTKRMGTSTTELLDLLLGLDYTLFDIGSQLQREVTYVDPQGTREINVVAIPV